MIHKGIAIEMPEDMTVEEAQVYVEEEIMLWQEKGVELGRIILKVDGDEVIIQAVEKSPIKHIRRITGYLSEVDNFNNAKRSELEQRVVHGRNCCCS